MNLLKVLSLTCTSLIAVGVAHLSYAHGGVVSEDDLCIINIGFYQAHFTVFQPRTQAHEQFCEDLPDIGESLFVVEYLHDGLEQLPLDFRIVKNTTQQGRYATWTDIEAIEDLQQITVYYQPATLEPDVLTIMHNFDTEGEYIGIVTTTHPETQTLYTAVFPFEVGSYGIDLRAVTVAVVVFIPLCFWLLGLRRRKTTCASGNTASGAMSAVVLFAALQFVNPQVAQAQEREPVAASLGWQASGLHYQVNATSLLAPLRINQIHGWRLSVTDKQGRPVTAASITVTGGMPDHDHGLPTEPRITKDLGDGTYLLQGMKFHMSGTWEVTLTISTPQVDDVVTLILEL